MGHMAHRKNAPESFSDLSGIDRRRLLGAVPLAAAASVATPNTARADVVYELGPVVLRTEDDPSINPKVRIVGTIDPAEMMPEVTDTCILAISVDGKQIGDLRVEVWGKVAPRTAQNFVDLCRGTEGTSYQGSSVFRVIPGINIGLGDVAGGGDKCVKTGTCVSAGGRPPLPVENYDAMHTVRWISLGRFGGKEKGLPP